MSPDTGNKMTAHQKTLRQSGFCSLPRFFFLFFFLFTVLSVCIGCSAPLCVVTPPSVKRRSTPSSSSPRGCEPRRSARAFILLRKAGAKHTALKRRCYSMQGRSARKYRHASELGSPVPLLRAALLPHSRAEPHVRGEDEYG